MTNRFNFTLEELWIRDKGTCWICKKMVMSPKNMHWDDLDNMPTRDHVIPRSKGGSNGRHNIKLAHRRCNEKRGNGD